MKIAIIQFPGSNCESESIRAVRAAGMEAEEFLWNRKPAELSAFDGFFIVGGFSYEDRSRAGVIASLDPIMKHLRAENEKGKPILGVCNGAQILVEAGFVPGCKDYQTVLALAENKRIKSGDVIGTGFYNAWATISLHAPPERCAFTYALPNDFRMNIPVAHAEGRFQLTADLLEELISRGGATFRYTTPDGDVINEFPINPNGSVYNLAGICNASGNVLALMPHPERAADGIPLFKSMRDYIASNKKVSPLIPIDYEMPHPPLTHYDPLESFEFVVESILTDNEAFTVESTLRNAGIPVRVKRYRHWQISAKDKDAKAIKNAIATGEFFNRNKERVIDRSAICNPSDGIAFLVRYREDSVGEKKRQTLYTQYDNTAITSVQCGIIWLVKPDNGSSDSIVQDALNTRIFHNQYSQEIYRYSPFYRGKVRDIYDAGNTLRIVTTNRLSAFDRIICEVPSKGAALNQISKWWFNNTEHIIANHLFATPTPASMIVWKCRPVPLEVVVRGYITGTTDTSLWMKYCKGEREFDGMHLPEGMKKNQKLPHPIVTPTTKDNTHDRPISADQIISQGILKKDEWEFISQKALELYTFGVEMASQRGLILVDTKYEFGYSDDGTIILIDELHTPDSSRYWIAETYEERMAAGKEPENFDKEFIRLWIKQNADPYNDNDLPPIPSELIQELSRRYRTIHQLLTGSEVPTQPYESLLHDIKKGTL